MRSRTFDEVIGGAKELIQAGFKANAVLPRPLDPMADADLLLYPYDDFGISAVREETAQQEALAGRAAEAAYYAEERERRLKEELAQLAAIQERGNPDLESPT